LGTFPYAIAAEDNELFFTMLVDVTHRYAGSLSKLRKWRLRPTKVNNELLPRHHQLLQLLLQQ